MGQLVDGERLVQVAQGPVVHLRQSVGAGTARAYGEVDVLSLAARAMRSGDQEAGLLMPPRVEYSLTEPGQALRKTVDVMCHWTQRHLGRIEASRHRFDA